MDDDRLQELTDVLDRWFPPGSAAPPAETHPEMDRFVLALGLHPDQDTPARASAIHAWQAGHTQRVDPDTLYALGQAFGRALGRVVDAEAEIVRRVLLREPPERRPAALSAYLAARSAVTHAVFAAVHDARLGEALRDILTEHHFKEGVPSMRTIALVDYVGSTAFLERADAAATARFVDALFEAGQHATEHRPVHAVKYLGDGVMLVGRDPNAVAEATLDALTRLDACRAEGLPAARAGIAMGPVARRAGDYFGLAVNLAARLAEIAPTCGLLADETLSEPLADRVTEQREVCLRGMDQPRQCMVVGTARSAEVGA